MREAETAILHILNTNPAALTALIVFIVFGACHFLFHLEDRER